MRLAIQCVAVLVGLGVLPGATQDLVGHGGPVGALDVYDDQLLSGGFDTRAILWDLGSSSALGITRFHDGNVTAVAFLPAGGFVTAGQDGRIAIWRNGTLVPDMASPAGVSAVASLDVAPDGQRVAAGFWDGRVSVLSLATGQVESYQAHSDRVSGLGFLPNGDLVSVGGDFRLMRWDRAFAPRVRADLPDLPNGLVVADDRIAVIFADGALRVFSEQGELLPERFLTDRPLVALAAKNATLATAAIDGTVWLLEGRDLVQRLMFQAATGPVWGLAMDETLVFTSGADGVIRRWSVVDGSALGSSEAPHASEYTDDSRGAEIWRACAVCHSLAPDDHSRAGPGLHGIFGRRIATAVGYEFSEALGSMEIVWTPQTVSDLFKYGPEAYTPGSRMPEQRIADASDRQALVEFLERASAYPAP